ncbi:HD-domain PDEase-like protein [Pholiota conissans]|uniref:HD-domain PDEase-like protein n=1 Tax=Pholiota conissans TaxID=109636 RepID=A0A9P6CPF6_9AGAR|nr:HD-domain PDEase-like protein [Pholiota conissans]
MHIPREALDDEIGPGDEMDYSCVVQTRDIKDPIHGNIKVYPALARFIDTCEFQRLRNIKQLGTTSFVWPAASHTRFEHSLGVACLARKIATHLRTSQPTLGITDRDIACVEIAGLCHDLGHGPWSHVWDNLFIPAVLKLETPWTHEVGSEMMLEYLLKENKIPMPVEDQEFVKALIAGDHSRVPHEKVYLFDIVANKRNGLDVDKLDYLCRDAHMCSYAINLDTARLIESARVLDDQICYNVKDVNLVYGFFHTRFSMHNTVYNHKTTKSIEYMVIDALSAANEYLGIAKRIFKPEEYVHLSDHILTEIESSKVPELAESRAIIKAMRRRQLYKFVEFKSIEWPFRDVFRKNITPARIMEAVKKILDKRPMGGDVYLDDRTLVSLEESDIIVNFSTRSFGMKEKNPVDFVRFYSKRNPNISSKADRGVITSVIPEYFAEDVLNIFTKKSECVSLVQAGYRELLATLEKQNQQNNMDTESTSGDTVSEIITPPDTDISYPSTPKTGLSRQSSLTPPQQQEGRSTPFSNNALMTLAPPFSAENPPQSPSDTRVTKRRRAE